MMLNPQWCPLCNLPCRFISNIISFDSNGPGYQRSLTRSCVSSCLISTFHSQTNWEVELGEMIALMEAWLSEQIALSVFAQSVSIWNTKLRRSLHLCLKHWRPPSTRSSYCAWPWPGKTVDKLMLHNYLSWIFQNKSWQPLWLLQRIWKKHSF